MRIVLFLGLIASVLFGSIDYEKYQSDDVNRESIILIDLGSKNKFLFGKVIKALKFAPHELVKMYYYNPKNGVVRNFYSFCYPKLTNVEIKKIDNGSFFDKALGTDVDRMSDDLMFLESKIIQKLSIVQKMMKTNRNSNISSALKSLSSDLNNKSRIFIFSDSDFKGEKVDLKDSYVYLYRSQIPSKKFNKDSKKYIHVSNGYLSSCATRVIDTHDTNSKILLFDENMFIKVKGKKFKAELRLSVSNNKIINGWFEIYGVMRIPIVGKASLDSNKLKSIEAIVPENLTLGKNIVKKGDKLSLKRKNGKLKGKYFNDAYVFNGSRFNYYSYEVSQ
ncbi:MAG: hypothetical protein GQ570_01000 [Helicobacteraceae bacterium]|nr:hypothetical protein [Helicobacteraceae bacterium]